MTFNGCGGSSPPSDTQKAPAPRGLLFISPLRGRYPRAVTTSTRDRLVATVIELLGELSAADLVSAIGTRAIGERAAVSASSIFYHFDSVADLADAVVAEVFRPTGLQMDAPASVLVRASRSALPLSESLDFHREDFDRLTTDPQFRARMGLWAFGGPEVAPVYQRFLRGTEAQLTQACHDLLTSWGRELRTPFEMTTFQAIHVALINGATLRHLVDPGTVSRESFARLATALTMIMLRVQGDTTGIEHRLAELNYFPRLDLAADVTPEVAVAQRTDDHVGDDWTSIWDRPEDSDTDDLAVASVAVKKTEGRNLRAVILDAAARLFGARGFAPTTFAEIAAEASVATSTLYRYFDSRDDLAAALVREHLADLVASRRPVVRGARQRFVAHLGDLAAFTRLHAGYVRPYLIDLITVPDLEDDPVVVRTRELIIDLATESALRDGVEVDFGVRQTIVAVMSEAMLGELRTDREIAEMAAALVLREVV